MLEVGRPGGALGAMVAEGTTVAWTGLLRRHAHLQGDRPALRFEGVTTTYAELDARVDRAAAALADLGVGPGARVVVLMGNVPAFVDVLGGIARLGAIAVPVNFRLVAPEIASLLDDSGAALVVADPERADAAAGAAKAAAGEVDVVVATGDGTGSWERAVAGAGAPPVPDEAVAAQWGADAPCLIMYTSGTTGRPKGAVLSHLNLVMQTITHMRTAGLRGAGDVGLVAAPLFHIAGVAAVVPSLFLGATVVLVRTGAFDPAATLDLMEREGVTSVFLVPTQWQAICELPDVAERTLRLRSISWGASPAPPSTLAAMGRAFPGVPNIAVFGQTEMSPVTCALDAEEAAVHTGSVGRPVPTVDARIVDEDMVDVAPGEVGEIVYRGPAMMLGYWRNPAGTAEAMAGGWFHSGDLVVADEDGFVTVVDRKKDMIISGGENIYSSEVEAAIDGHPKVREVAVVAGPHPRWVETPVAFVVPADPADPPTAAEVIEATAGRLAAYKRPTRVEVVAELPRNAGGKVLKTDLRRRLAGA